VNLVVLAPHSLGLVLLGGPRAFFGLVSERAKILGQRLILGMGPRDSGDPGQQ